MSACHWLTALSASHALPVNSQGGSKTEALSSSSARECAQRRKGPWQTRGLTLDRPTPESDTENGDPWPFRPELGARPLAHPEEPCVSSDRLICYISGVTAGLTVTLQADCDVGMSVASQADLASTLRLSTAGDQSHIY